MQVKYLLQNRWRWHRHRYTFPASNKVNKHSKNVNRTTVDSQSVSLQTPPQTIVWINTFLSTKPTEPAGFFDASSQTFVYKTLQWASGHMDGSAIKCRWYVWRRFTDYLFCVQTSVSYLGNSQTVDSGKCELLAEVEECRRRHALELTIDENKLI